jgi:hypothetical protein
MNTVWYKFIATNTTMKIKTQLLTLFNSQIALYDGPCGAVMTEPCDRLKFSRGEKGKEVRKQSKKEQSRFRTGTKEGGVQKGPETRQSGGQQRICGDREDRRAETRVKKGLSSAAQRQVKEKK